MVSQAEYFLVLPSCPCNNNIYHKYRLYTEVKVSIGFIILSDEVARLINAMKTVPRYLTGLYHDHNNNVTHIHAIKRLYSNIIFISNDAPWKYFILVKKKYQLPLKKLST